MAGKEAITLCKTILRNGYDAYIINTDLQEKIQRLTGANELDIACEPDFQVLGRLLPEIEHCGEEGVLAILRNKESGWVYRFYSSDAADASHPEASLMRLTPHMLSLLQKADAGHYASVALHGGQHGLVYEDRESGCVRLDGIPQLTLARNYTLAIRAMRMAANYDLPIEPASWVAIIQANENISSYVPPSDFLAEWRQVAAENMWRFIQLLSDCALLHAILPEIGALRALRQNRSKSNPEEQTVFQHTIDSMRAYPQEKLHHDWIGTVGVLFQDVGKLYTAELFDGRWTFFQHHRVGAKITRKILRRLGFEAAEIETICNMVRNQTRFHSMLTDRGIRRFLALPDTPRLIEMARAHLKAQDGSYTNFNHNCKYLERGETPLEMVEPFLNGKEIMEVTGRAPGPEVGEIREALLQAQIQGLVTDMASAVTYVRNYQPLGKKK